MAEVKNAFIKSKMNKDLDDRLLPPGEYREGLNIQVSKSEGEDVGALENALGNSKALIASSGNTPITVDFSVLAGLPSGTLKSIGIYGEEAASTIFVFLTDFTDAEFPGALSYSATANNYIYSYNTLTRAAKKLASGSFLNFSTTHAIIGVNLLENLLFWTDNRNQPRKINIDLVGDGSYYNNEDKISVAKYNPYEVIQMYYQDTEPQTPYGSSNPNFNQYVCAGQDVVSENLPDGTTSNMYFDNEWPGDPDYLKNKFVSFSYRFKFTDGEYSILAPFTQEAFIPQQDGYFLRADTDLSGNSLDENEAYRSSIVEFMRNKINNIKLAIPLPTNGSDLESTLGVTEIDIIWKESDALAVKVLDSIPSTTFSSTTNNVYTYDYQSRKPYKTLPESEIIRVYDKVPVRALGQEVISNRVVYSNFQDKHTPPATINYDVAVTDKSAFSVSNSNSSLFTTSQIEYPEHTLKQNRNYQVGIVLSDRYGRQSTTILSPVNSEFKTAVVDGATISFGGSTYYHPYKPNPGAGNNDVHAWPGDSLKLLVNAGVNSTKSLITGTPGLYNGDTSSPDYNPLGWYSYKVVVKQTETDYYNVYLPGVLNDYPDYKSTERTDAPDPQGTIAHISLISDNINKVPRDLTEVGPEQTQYRSDVKLFGRVTPNFILDTAPTFNEPYYPETNTMTVAAIAEQDNMFTDANRAAPYNTVYQTDSDPYIARISQNNVGVAPLPLPVGSSSINQITGAYNIILGVFETAPFESLLDIFYETSTCGLVSDFNALAGNDNGALAGWITNNIQGFKFTQTEASVLGEVVLNNFTAALPGLGIGAPIPLASSEITLLSVIDGNSNNVTADWVLKPGENQPHNTYKLEVVNPKYFETNQLSNVFTFTFNVKSTGVDAIDYGPTSISGIRLGNVSPSITNADSFTSIPGDRTDPDLPIFTFEGVNGAVPPLDNVADLSWSISNQNPPSDPLISIDQSTGKLYAPLDITGAYSFTITLTDSGGATTTAQIGAVAGEELVNSNFGKYWSANPLDLSKRIQSSALFWCNDYSNALEGPYPDDYDEARTGGLQAIELPQSGFNNTNIIQTAEQQLSAVDSEDRNYFITNENIKTKRFDSSVSLTNNSLTNGTAFIKVDFIFDQWPYAAYDQLKGSGPETVEVVPPPGQSKVSWTAYLQRRPVGGGWGNVLDVEGNTIRFGGEQKNKNNSDTTSDFFTTGILTNASSYNIDPSNEVRPPQDTVSAGAEFPQAQNQESITSTLSKIFAFGKDQGYGETVDQYGDYRLLVLYPQDGVRSSAYDRNTIIPTVTGTMPSSSVYSYRGTSNILGIKVNISYGDFYYPPFGQENKSFAYKVSQSGTAGEVDSYNASTQGNNGTTVYAREWAMKYVTQFYTDQALTTSWVPSNADGNYHVYHPLQQQQEDWNSEFGTENSSFTSQTTSINTFATKNYTRRYTAQFDNTGKKIKGSANPLQGNVPDN